MAGTPKKRQYLQIIKDRGGFGAIYGRIGAGEDVKTIAAEYGISYGMFRRILCPRRDQKRRELYADALMDKAQSLADAVEVDNAYGSARVQKTRMQVELLKHRAAKLDAEFWGEKPAGLNVQIDVGSLHVEALRSVPKPKPIHLQIEAPKDGGNQQESSGL